MMNIVVVGGGAGGLELATSLGRKLGKKNKARITLVDRNRTHLWKPLLHEVATGSMDAGIDALSYQSHAKNHGFEFQLGSLTDIKRDEKRIVLAPIHDDSGALVVNERELAYDVLVMAIGSVSNDFNTKGIKDHCIFLDSPSQAHRFYNSMMNRFLQFATEYQPGDKVKIAIVGGGATGVELSAELYNAVEQLYAYGFKNLTTADFGEGDKKKPLGTALRDFLAAVLPVQLAGGEQATAGKAAGAAAGVAEFAEYADADALSHHERALAMAAKEGIAYDVAARRTAGV